MFHNRPAKSLFLKFKLHQSFCAALALGALAAPANAQPAAVATAADGSHDFDFEFGFWAVHLKRRLHPLTGTNEWVEYDGTSVVRKVWGGAANLGELDVHGPSGSIRALSLRLFDPATRQWKISFANQAAPDIGVPMIGGFRDGRGEFYDGETLAGRQIFVRFIFSEITHSTFKFEQAFSADGGKSWEPNWVATFVRTDEK